VRLRDRAHLTGKAGGVDTGANDQQRMRQPLGDPRVAYPVAEPDLVLADERVGLSDEAQDGLDHILAVCRPSRQVLRAERPIQLDSPRDNAEQVSANSHCDTRLIQTLRHDRSVAGRPGGLGEDYDLAKFGQGGVDDLQRRRSGHASYIVVAAAAAA
jgi:hypothetical protein